MVLDERLPRLRLRRLHPRQHVVGEQRPRPVVLRRVAFGVEPAVRGEVLADLDLEADLLVQAHAASVSTSPRTSILPVTAAEIRADFVDVDDGQLAVVPAEPDEASSSRGSPSR